MLQGSIVALVTPMLDNDEVDYTALQALVKFHLEKGTDGFVVAGSTGESATLTTAEQQKILALVIETAGKNVPVIMGTGTNSTTKTIDNTLAAKKSGADMCLIVAPYYNKPTQEGVYQHFQAIAAAVDIPIMLYNHPGRTGCDIEATTVARLAKIPNIIGIKEATGKIERTREIRQQCTADFLIFSGDDPLTLELIQAGGNGVISVLANILPQPMRALAYAALKGDMNTAEEIDKSLQTLYQAMVIETNPIPVKWALHDMGMIKAGIRLPLTPLSLAKREELHNVLQKKGLC